MSPGTADDDRTLEADIARVVSSFEATGAVDLEASIQRALHENAGREGALPLISLGEGTPGTGPSSGVTPGSQEPDLQLVGLLGSGGMGAVFTARQRALSREVALKRPLSPAASPEVCGALLQEGRTMGRLEHPNIVPVHALGCDRNGQPVLVMKRIEGLSWREILRHPERAQVPEIARQLARGLDFHLEVLMQLCNALHFAHTRGVIHRDVKPENVMIGAFGEVYLLDWGIARHVEREEPRQVVGTPAYMAPEMLLTPERADARTDVYLLGATLHEVLVGRPLHDGATFTEVVRSALRASPFAYPPSVPRALAALCRAATDPDPDKRPPTCAAFREELAEYLAHRAARDLGASAGEKLAAAEARLEVDRTRLADIEVGMLLAEARFGLEQSLRQWPDNSDASDALARCLAWAIERELLARNGAAARALLASLPTPRLDLETRVEELDRELEAARAREVEQARNAQDLDASVSARPRLLFFAVFGLVGVGLSIAMYLEEQRAGRPAPMSQQVQLDSAVLALLAAGLLLGRRRLLANAFNRRIWAMWAITCTGILFLDVFLASIPVTSWQATVVDFTLMSAVFAAGAALFDRFLGWIALLGAMATVTSALVPWLSTPAATLTLFLAVMLNMEQARRSALRADRFPAGTAH